MTTNYHDPMSGGDVASPINFNSRFSDLDSAITNIGNSSANSIQAVVGEGVAVRQAGFIDLDDGLGYLLDADSALPRADTIRGFWQSTEIATATGTLQISGIMSGFAGLTSGQPIYVDTVAGTITQTRPSPSSGGSQIAIMQMGIAVSATEILIDPIPIQYHKRNAMADTDTLTITHHGDVNGYRRNIWAYITETIAGAEATGYASSNQDVDVSLRDRAPATYGSDVATSGFASASSTGVGSAGAAFDDDGGTRWGSNVTGAANDDVSWLKQDFGAANDKTIRRVNIDQHNVGFVSEIDIQYSDDDSAWTTALSVTGADATATDYDLPAVGSHRYWRLLCKDATPATGFWQVAEVEMKEAATFTDGDDKLAQTFTLSGSTNIGGVGLWLKKVGSPTGTATVRIETVSAGDPTGTLADAAATITFDESSLGASYAEKLLTFASEFTLGAGTYALVLSTDRAASEANYISWGADGSAPSYAGGEMLSEISSTWSAEAKDAVFSVYEPGVTHPSRVSVDWWSSTYADMVNRYGDGSGNNLSSQTTSKCVRAAGFDDVTFVVELP